MRKAIYVSGTRADFGLMKRSLLEINDHSELSISVCVTGMHLDQRFGYTFTEIKDADLPIAGEIPVDLSAGNGAAMSIALGEAVVLMTSLFERERPDVVLVLGDRGEMLAAAIAAIHLNIPIAHIHGGELSGTVDEPVRHAISKLSHIHFVTTEGARERLVKMGERVENIFISGAPGLDGILESASSSKQELFDQQQFDVNLPATMLLFHPVLQEADVAGEQVDAILQVVTERKLQTVCLLPNSDGGNDKVRARILAYKNNENFRIVTHFERQVYLSWLKWACFLIGNSSSGIIEAASFDLPVINVGSRQSGRERSANVYDVPADAVEIAGAIDAVMALNQKKYVNVYGDGTAGKTICRVLSQITLDSQLLKKQNTY